MTALQTARQHPAPEFIAVRSALVDIYWAAAWELLRPAVARNGLYTEESIRNALRAQEMQLWMVETGDEYTMAAVTEIAQYPARKIGVVLFMGGANLDREIQFLDEIEGWARAHGCDRFVNWGRPGLRKKLEQRGYQFESIAMVKDFTDA